ncbi:MAG: PDZ domain-containing protein, partial [Planctomycetes bacterium]|nr:PDZ domain-containing protein [Planctomycetota bacterium]
MNMKRSWIIPLVAVSAGLALAARSQSGSGTPLTPVDDGAGATHVEPLQAAFDAAHWKAALTQDDFAARYRAMRELIGEARTNPDARAALEEWAKGSDSGLAWTAYVALAEVQASPHGVRTDPFDSWFHGGPMAADPLDDDFFGQGGFGRGMFRGDPFAISDLMREMQESLDRLPQGAERHSQGLSIESGPDGVKVERRTNVDGDETVETYEAESMEQLLELHPELKDELRLQPLSGGQDEMRSLLDQLRTELDLPHSVLEPGEVRTDVLGVMMREANAWRGRVDGLEPGTGLYVENVLPGTIAEAVGLRPGDIVAKLNGTPLKTAADVRAVLDARAEDGALVIEWFDRSGAAQ